MTNTSGTQTGFCMKCKAHRAIKEAREEISNGTRMLKGLCTTCGTKVNRILGKA